ncbi:SRPBCC family protein [Arthrobacter sp. NPDC055138]
MQLERTFSVTAPIGTVWETLMDFERVAGCIPGAQILEKTSEDEYQVAMKVKLGPVTMQYKGTLHVVERDADARRATLQGKAREARGQGAAEATVTMQLSESGTATEASVNADLTLSGKAAAMGKSVIGSVTDQMLAVFTKNLQEMIKTQDTKTPDAGAEAAPASAEPASAASPSATSSSATSAVKESAPRESAPSAPPPAAGTQRGSAAETQPAAPPSSSSPAPASASAGRQGESSLDGLAMARQVLADQLRSPGKVLGLVLVAAALAHLAGRRSGRRQAVALLRSGGV